MITTGKGVLIIDGVKVGCCRLQIEPACTETTWDHITDKDKLIGFFCKSCGVEVHGGDHDDIDMSDSHHWKCAACGGDLVARFER